MISLLRGTSIVAGLTLISRVLGFLRDLLVASLLGAGPHSDAYLVAFRIPNMLRSLFAEGALTSAFVPTFSQALERGLSNGANAFKAVAKFLALTTGGVTILGILFAPQIIELVAPGFKAGTSGGHAEQAVLLLRIMFPYIMAVSLVALINGALNSLGIFGASAYAQIVMNLCLIAGALVAACFSNMEASLLILAASVVMGGIVQVVVQVPALRRAKLWGQAGSVDYEGRKGTESSEAGQDNGDTGLWSPAVKSTIRLMGPAIVGSAVYQLSVFLMTALSSLVSSGAVSWLFYADRLIQLPIGVFSVALSSVLLPALARAHAKEDQRQFEDKLIMSLRFATLLIVPVAILIWEHSETLVWILFERGEFSRQDTLITAQVVSAMAFGIWIITCQSLLSTAFISRKDPVTPTLAGAVSLVGTVVFALVFMGPVRAGGGNGSGAWLMPLMQLLQSWLPSANYGAAGLALGNTLAMMTGTLLLLIALPFRVLGLSWRGFLRCATQCWLAGALGVWIARMFAGGVVGVAGLEANFSAAPSLIAALVSGGIFFSVYLGVLTLSKNPELRDTLGVLRRMGR